jgi:hypothetical protein
MRVDVAACVKRNLFFFLIGALIITSWSCTEIKTTIKSDTPIALPGLATATSLVTQVITPASVRDTVDSLESALLAIRLSNMTLLHTPLSKDCQWPADFSKAPSQETLVKMGISGAVMSQGGSAAFERDPYTGLPRPTSPFYLLLKEKETLLKRTKRPRRNGHKNALRAFGVVSLNNKEVAELERELAYSEKGYKQCAGLVRSSDKTFSRGIKEDYCPSEARKHTKLDLIKENKDALKEDRDNAKKNYVPLAKKVNRIFLANLDYLGAALTQITGAILKMSSAINNVKNEFRRLPPREVAMLITRMENIKQIAPYFPQCISDHITIYKKLYSILREEYDDLLDDDEKKAAQQTFERILATEIAYQKIHKQIAALDRGEEVRFTEDEQALWERLAALYPSEPHKMDQDGENITRIVAMSFKTERNSYQGMEAKP